MTQLQPDIMIVNCLHQNGCDTGSIGAKGIRKDLIAHQSAIPGTQGKFCKAFLNSLGKRFIGMGDAWNPETFAKNLHPLLVAVGHHTKLNIGLGHSFQPTLHFRSWGTGSVWHNGIIKVQHQQFDATAAEQFWGDIRQSWNNDFR